MGSLVLLTWAETAWDAAGRIVSRTPVFLSDTGRARCAAWAEGIAALGPRAVYSSDEPASEETAQIVAARCDARHFRENAFAEVDAGLWAGLTYDELKRRDPKIFKRWFDDPTSVCPPDGEELTAASRRLASAFAEVVRRRGDKGVVVVLGPMAFAVSRCAFESVDLAGVRSMTKDDPLRYDVLNGRTMELAPPTMIVVSEDADEAPVTVIE